MIDLHRLFSDIEVTEDYEFGQPLEIIESSVRIKDFNFVFEKTDRFRVILLNVVKTLSALVIEVDLAQLCTVHSPVDEVYHQSAIDIVAFTHESSSNVKMKLVHLMVGERSIHKLEQNLLGVLFYFGFGGSQFRLFQQMQMTLK